MSNQRRTIMGACEYSIATLQTLKKDLMVVDAKNQEMNWAIGGIVATLTSQLLKTCNEVFTEAAQTGEPNAKQDLNAIKERFSQFIDQMVNHD